MAPGVAGLEFREGLSPVPRMKGPKYGWLGGNATAGFGSALMTTTSVCETPPLANRHIQRIPKTRASLKVLTLTARKQGGSGSVI